MEEANKNTVRIPCTKLKDNKRVSHNVRGKDLEDAFDKIIEANKFKTTIWIGKQYKEKYIEYLQKPKPSKQ